MIDRQSARSWSKDRILQEISELKEKIRESEAYLAELREEMKEYDAEEGSRRIYPKLDAEEGYISSYEADIELLKGLL
jgi:hypothetical protein